MIKTIVNESKDLPYPKLMVSDAGMILFVIGERNDKLCALVLSKVENYYYSENFDKVYFKDFKGSITLQNEGV